MTTWVDLSESDLCVVRNLADTFKEFDELIKEIRLGHQVEDLADKLDNIQSGLISYVEKGIQEFQDSKDTKDEAVEKYDEYANVLRKIRGLLPDECYY